MRTINMLSGWTPLRRNFTYGFRVAKGLSSLMSFCSPFYFPANDCCFACISFHIFVLPFLLHFLLFPVLSVLFRTSPLKILLSMPAPGTSSSVLPFTSLYPFLPCTSFPSCIFLSRTFHVCSALSLPGPSLSSSALPSLYLSLPYLPVLWILRL